LRATTAAALPLSLDRQHHSAGLTAARHLGQRAGRLTGVRGEVEDHVVGAVGADRLGFDSHHELGPFHRQLADFLGHEARELLGRRPAERGQAGRRPVEPGLRVFQAPEQRGLVKVGVLDRRELGLSLGQVREHGRLWLAVLAEEPLQVVEPCGGLFQRARIGLEAVEIATKLPGCVGEGGVRVAEEPSGFEQTWIDLGQAPHLSGRDSDRIPGRRLATGQPLQCQGRPLSESLGVLEPLDPAGELLGLAKPQPGLGDLAHLEPQEVQPLLALALARSRGR
jgi:hypothetical protein